MCSASHSWLLEFSWGTQNQTWRCVFGILGRKQTTFSAAYTGFNILDTVDRNMEYGDQEHYDLHDTNVVDSNEAYIMM